MVSRTQFLAPASWPSDAADWLQRCWESPESQRSYPVRCALRDLMLARRGYRFLHGRGAAPSLMPIMAF